MKNKSAKEKLIELYGAECFIEKLHLRKDNNIRYYTNKGQLKRMKQLTYHHILERRYGGEATVENGALLSAENHEWFNKQPSAIQSQLNKIFQEYKKCNVVYTDDLPQKIEIRIIQFDLQRERKYNRAKEKELVRKMIDDCIR